MTEISLTVVGGFLGAGKTTVINHLLRTGARRWGVLVNDFGTINIDAALIEARDGDTISLTNGCVCCGLTDDLGLGLARLVARTPAPEHVIVEASGVSDPLRIAQHALVEPEFALQPIVVVVDAGALFRQANDRWIADTVRQQIATAELVVLNKIDVAGREAVAEAVGVIHSIRPQARILAVAQGAVPVDALRFPVAPPQLAGRFVAEVPHGFRTWEWMPPGLLHRGRLRQVLLGLPPSVLRVKGFCRLAPDGGMNLLQYAAGQWALTPASDSCNIGLVVVGTAELLNAEELTPLFGAANDIVTPA